MDPATIDAIVKFLAYAGPQIVGLVVHLKEQETVTTIDLLSSDEAGFGANNQQIDDWISSHPVTA